MSNINGHDYEFINFTDIDDDQKKKVLEWRNDLSIRKWMYNQDPIQLEDHLNFIKSLKTRKDKLYFLVRRDREDIGVFSLVDFNGVEGEWGYYMSPRMHNRNLGVEFYYATLKYCFESIQVKKIMGFALNENKGANSLNSLFGFEKLNNNKEVNEVVFFQVILTTEKWNREVINDIKIKKLLDLTNKKHQI